MYSLIILTDPTYLAEKTDDAELPLLFSRIRIERKLKLAARTVPGPDQTIWLTYVCMHTGTFLHDTVVQERGEVIWLASGRDVHPTSRMVWSGLVYWNWKQEISLRKIGRWIINRLASRLQPGRKIVLRVL